MSDNDHPGEEREPVEVITVSEMQNTPRIGSLRMLMRLVLGSAVIGREELKNRFQDKQNEAQIPAAELNRVTPIDSDADRARYAVIGATANSSEALRKSISKLGQVSDRSFGRLTRTVYPVTNSRFLKPFRRQYQRYLNRGDQVVSAWVAAGRREEYLGRLLAQEIATETIEETLDYLADSPEMDELIEQQSVDLVNDILFDDIKESASNTPLILTSWFNTTILRRNRQKKADPSHSSTGEESQDE